MNEQLERRKIVEKVTPSIRDNLAIETPSGLLDVEVDGEAVTRMLLKGVKPKDRDNGRKVMERMEIFFGKRPFPEVLGEKLKEVMKKRDFPEGVSGGVSGLGRFAYQIQDNLIDGFGWHRDGAYFHDSEAPFIWLNMPQLTGDTSWEGFKNTWRHELGHVYDAIENGDMMRFQDVLVYLGTACGIEVMAGAGGFLVCRTVEKIIDRKKTPEQKKEIKVSRRQFLRAVATGTAVIASTPFMHEGMIKFVRDKTIAETEAEKRSTILTDEEIMAAFQFHFKNT